MSTQNNLIVVTKEGATEVLPLLMRHASLLDEMLGQQILHCDAGDETWMATSERLKAVKGIILQLAPFLTLQ